MPDRRRLDPSAWGPSHQRPPRPDVSWRTWAPALLVFVVLSSVWSGAVGGLCFLVTVGLVLWRLFRWLDRRGLLPHRASRTAPAAALSATTVHLGLSSAGDVRWSSPRRAVLVVGPSQSGKTTGVIIPTLRTYRGPAVSTSTKPDVLRATLEARLEFGRVWQFDPTGTAELAFGAERLGWSPLLSAGEWDGALLVARAMVDVAGVGHGTTDWSHWSKRAQALLASLLHAAALAGEPMRTVIGWISAHDPDPALSYLREQDGSALALDVLTGVANTDARERASIFSSAADALEAYTSKAALDAAADTNFYAGRFVRSTDTVFIYASAEAQRLATPLVCGLLAEIRRATYQAHAAGVLKNRVLFALDEVANTAPIAELPQIASEGAGQGLLLLAVLQDLSQARHRWSTLADGFLTLFGTKLILPGVADPRTLDAISVALGEYDRTMVSETRTHVKGQILPQRGHTTSTQRQRVLSPGEIANIPAGRALHLEGVRWELLNLAPAGR